MSHATGIGNDILSHNKPHQHFRGESGGVTKIYEGQVEEEEVHGGVQVRVQPYQGDQAQVSHHSNHIET